jgi:hypothetical protein
MDLAIGSVQYMQIKTRPQSANHGDRRTPVAFKVSEHAESGKSVTLGVPLTIGSDDG